MLNKVMSTIIIFSFLMFAAGCGSGEKLETKSAPTKAPAQTSSPEQIVQATQTPDNNIPSFSAYDLHGNIRQSNEWLGQKPTVINFWGTWCPPCRVEIPDLIKLYDEYNGKGIEIVSLAVRDTPEQVDKFTKANKMNWVMLMADPKFLVGAFSIRSVPTTIFFDKDGNEKARFVGAQNYSSFKQAFESIL